MSIAKSFSSLSNISGSVQGQVGQGFEQSDLVKDVPVHGRGEAGLDNL